MTTRIGMTCTQPRCRKVTKDPTGKCHLHRRWVGVPDALVPRIPPRLSPTGATTTVVRPKTVGGKARIEEFHGGGDPNRPGSPNYVEYSKDDVVISEAWVDRSVPNPVFSRKDGPARIDYYANGSTLREHYVRSGLEHRDGDFPAQVAYSPDGRVSAQVWMVEGKEHRLGNPSRVETHPDGEYARISWSRNGKLSRIDGPADSFMPERAPRRDVWSLDGKTYPTYEALLDAAADLPDPDLDEHFENTKYDVLLAEGGSSRALLEALRGGVRTPEGLREVMLAGAPVEWVRSYEESQAS